MSVLECHNEAVVFDTDAFVVCAFMGAGFGCWTAIQLVFKSHCGPWVEKFGHHRTRGTVFSHTIITDNSPKVALVPKWDTKTSKKKSFTYIWTRKGTEFLVKMWLITVNYQNFEVMAIEIKNLFKIHKTVHSIWHTPLRHATPGKDGKHL